MKNLTIIGGGPAALILAAELDTKKYKITICEKKKAVGRKFLVAGEGGLNLTYNSSLEDLISNYHPAKFFEALLPQFTNEDLIKWMNAHGIPTFIGSSNRVFPDLELKPVEVLNKITEHIEKKKINFKLDAEWSGWNDEGDLTFKKGKPVKSDITVFALGGASWKVTGSDGSWSKSFADKGVKMVPFRAANCAFGVDWEKNFITTHAGKPLKNIALTFGRKSAKGELVVSEFGLEGNAIYALSQKIQEKMLTEKSVIVKMDLKPSMTLAQIKAKYKKSKSTKVTNILKKDLNLDRTAIGLLKHFTDKETFSDPILLAKAIKAVPVTITPSAEIDKAISTLGGVSLTAIDKDLQLKKVPNSYVIGEMLDWYAPTGGYLLQGCFSMGFVLAKHLNELEG